MIKANELRLENRVWLVYAPYGNEQSRAYQRIDIYEMKRAAGILSVNSFYHEPIPLTPEILEKAGFKKFQYGDNNQFTGYEVRWSKDSIYGFLTPGNIFSLLGFERRHQNIQYLHQLQNLFFDLTGEELEVNL